MALTHEEALNEQIQSRTKDIEDRVRLRLATSLSGRKPEGNFDKNGTWLPSERENIERFSYLSPPPNGNPMRYRVDRLWNSIEHCRRLVTAFFAGVDVPPDVASVCTARAETYREALLKKDMDGAIAWVELEKRRSHADAIAAFEASPEGRLKKAEERKASLLAKLEESRKSFEAYEKMINTRISRLNKSIGQLKRRTK